MIHLCVVVDFIPIENFFACFRSLPILYSCNAIYSSYSSLYSATEDKDTARRRAAARQQQFNEMEARLQRMDANLNQI